MAKIGRTGESFLDSDEGDIGQKTFFRKNIDLLTGVLDINDILMEARASRLHNLWLIMKHGVLEQEIFRRRDACASMSKLKLQVKWNT